MTNIDQQATERVQKARAALILARRFYGVLVSNVEPVLSRSVPTMATNSVQHFYNPDFIATLTQEELEGVQAHETEHDARHHSTRRNGRDPKKWNEACDYAINGDLIAEGFKLPKGVLIDARFTGMSAEDIYRTLELDEQKQQPQDSDDSDGDDEQSDDDEQPGEQDDEPGDEQADDEQDGDDGDEGNGDDASDEGDEDGNGGAGDGDDDDASEGDGAGGEGDGEAEGQGAGNGEGEGGEGEGQPTSSGDPGMCGEVLDAPADSAGEASDIDTKWERIVRQAASMAKAVGQLPGHISRDIERANNPGQDWREQLRAWFDQGALQTETWNRPNRRFIGHGLHLPGRQRDGINRAAFLIDTSGSMDDIALGMIRNETQVALDDGVIDEIVVIYGDTQVNRVDTYKTGDEIEFDPRGGGGTILKPLFDHVRTLDDVSLIVCFTDMENNDWGDTPDCPVLFAATGYPNRVRELLANAPWGSPGIDVGAH